MTKTIYTNAAELVCALRAAALAAPSASCLAEWGKWEESAKKTNTAHGLASADTKPVANASAEEFEQWSALMHASRAMAQSAICELRSHAPDLYRVFKYTVDGSRSSMRIKNSRERLEQMAALVEKKQTLYGGGIARTAKPRAAVTWPAQAVKMVRELLEDGDAAGALELAESKAGALFFCHGNGAFMLLAPVPVDGMPGFLSVQNELGKFDVIEARSGTSIGGAIARSRTTAVELARAQWAAATDAARAQGLERCAAMAVDSDAARALWMVQHGLKIDDDVLARIEAKQTEALEAHAAASVAAVVADAVAAVAIEQASEAAALGEVATVAHATQDAQEVAAPVCAMAEATSSTGTAPSSMGSASSSHGNTPRGQTVTSKSGNWSARFYTAKDGSPAMAFSKPSKAPGYTDTTIHFFEDGRERMQALQRMARKADADAGDTPPRATHTEPPPSPRAIDYTDAKETSAPQAKAFDPKEIDAATMTAKEAQALRAQDYAALLDHLEDINCHSEYVLVQALRAGRADLIHEARMLLAAHKDAGRMSHDMIEQRRGLQGRIRAVLDSCTDTPEASGTPPVQCAEGGRSTPPTPAPRNAPDADCANQRETSGSGFQKKEPLTLNLRTYAATGLPLDALIGAGVRYSGDVANPDGVGAIVSAEPCKWAGVIVGVQLEDGRSMSITGAAFGDKAGDRYRLDGKMHGTPYLAQLAAAVAARKAAASSAKELEAQAYAAELERLAAEFPQLQRAKSRYTGGKLVAANIRILLKAAFKGTKFSVTSNYSEVKVRWTDGPTDKQVNDIISRFDIGAADYNTDYFYTVRTAFSELFGGVQYLFTERALGEAAINASLAALYGKNGPSFADWEAGKAWKQVAHGSAGHDRYDDNYGWLSHVRRHANGK